MTNANWENIDSAGTTQRTPVPGGWLIRTWDVIMDKADALTVVADPEHAWLATEQAEPPKRGRGRPRKAEKRAGRRADMGPYDKSEGIT